MPTERTRELFLMILFAGVAARLIAGPQLDRLNECRAIEQATYDREFWELVGADG